jgi:antitoxin component YwqK of YwqJK toxin-antitoxin module
MKLILIINLFAATLPEWHYQNDCEPRKEIIKEKKKVEIRTDCILDRGEITEKILTEFSKGLRDGKEEVFFASGKLRQITHYRKGVKADSFYSWDSLGNVLTRGCYKKGKEFGYWERFFSPGHPRLLITYNDSGNEEGPSQLWWPNGNKKGEYVYKNGQHIIRTEYYPNGKPRIHDEKPYQAGDPTVFKLKLSNGETWAPNGKSCGKIVDGNGELILWSEGPDSATGKYIAVKDIYKDSTLVKMAPLDSATIEKWLK